MELLDAITRRRSFRSYQPKPVPKEILEKVLDTCRYVSSWSNTQCWELHILSGKPLNELRQALAEKMAAEEIPIPDVPPPEFSEVYLRRKADTVERSQRSCGVSPDDKEACKKFDTTMIRFFEAPVGLIACTERSAAPAALLDIGIAFQTIMLAAFHYGLGTCTEYSVVMYADVLRRLLGIPESKLIALGMAIGYADLNAPVNNFARIRYPLETFVNWRGFE
jgi:nitroreductase